VVIGLLWGCIMNLDRGGHGDAAARALFQNLAATLPRRVR